MDSKDYEKIVDRLVALSDRQELLIARAAETDDKRQKESDKLLHFAREVSSHCTNEVKHMSNAIEAIKKDREETLNRCDILLKQNSDLLEQNRMITQQVINKDKELNDLRMRYDRIVELLESSILSGNQKGHSAANVTFNGLKSLHEE